MPQLPRRLCRGGAALRQPYSNPDRLILEKVGIMWKRVSQILVAPETNLFLFAFLLNFVYEVWQAPYYEFYRSPSLAEKIKDLTHCSFGDGVIILISN